MSNKFTFKIVRKDGSVIQEEKTIYFDNNVQRYSNARPPEPARVKIVDKKQNKVLVDNIGEDPVKKDKKNKNTNQNFEKNKKWSKGKFNPNKKEPSVDKVLEKRTKKPKYITPEELEKVNEKLNNTNDDVDYDEKYAEYSNDDPHHEKFSKKNRKGE